MSLESNNQLQDRESIAKERKEIPPVDSGYTLMMSRQKSLPISEYRLSTPVVEDPKGITAEGFIFISEPEKKDIIIAADGTITASDQASAIGETVFGLPAQSDDEGVEDSEDTNDFTMEVAQNIKYLRGPVEVRVKGWSDDEEFKSSVVQNIDALISKGANSIADVAALYQLRLRAAGVPAAEGDIELPDNVSHKLGEEFGEEYVYDYDADSVVATTPDGKKVKKTSGVWFSFQESPTGEDVVYDSFISWNGEEQPQQEAEQAVGLLLHNGKVLLNVEYCPAMKSYELVAVGGGFKAGQGADKIKDRIKKTINAEAAEEQGASLGDVRFLTDEDKPMLNAPNHYAQKTHLVLAEVNSFGDKDLDNADEVTELGLVSLSMDELDSMIVSGTIKDPSIIAARAVMVAKQIQA